MIVFLAAVVVGKVVSVTFGAFLTGQSIQTAVKSGMSLAQIGEFSFIIAGIGVATEQLRGCLCIPSRWPSRD